MVFSMLTVASAAPEDETATIKVAVFSMAAEDESLLKSAVNTWFAENDVIVEGKKASVSFENVTKAQIVAGELGKIMTCCSSARAAVEPWDCPLARRRRRGGGGIRRCGRRLCGLRRRFLRRRRWLQRRHQKSRTDQSLGGSGSLEPWSGDSFWCRPRSANIISNGMRLDRKYIAYGINPAVLTPGESDDPNMGEVVNVVSYISNPTNNVPVGTDLSDVIDMTGTPGCGLRFLRRGPRDHQRHSAPSGEAAGGDEFPARSDGALRSRL